MAKSNKSIIDKLTALWALNESGLGGFMHVFNTPFTGLVVGGISILLISLIAYYAEHKWQAILKALVLVLIIKMAVSPYSPIGAYVAVSFQAVFAALLFSGFSWRGMTLIVLGLVTFLQSSLQKLLILTVVYGTEFWEAINIYGNWVKEKLNIITETSTVSVLVTSYLLIYAICGVLAGVFIKSIIEIIAEKKEVEFCLDIYDKKPLNTINKQKFKPKVIWIWLLTVTLVVLAFSLFGDALLGWKKAIYVVLRSFLILMLWYLVLGPLVIKILRKYLQSKQPQYEHEIADTMDLFPHFRQIISYTWKDTSHLKGYRRFKCFIADSISNCIHFKS